MRIWPLTAILALACGTPGTVPIPDEPPLTPPDTEFVEDPGGVVFGSPGPVGWAVAQQGPRLQTVQHLVVDAERNVHTIGLVSGQTTFRVMDAPFGALDFTTDNEAIGAIVAAPEDETSVVYARYDEAGTLVTAQLLATFDNIGSVSSVALTDDGDLVLGGEFRGTMTLLGGDTYTTPGSGGPADAFVTRLSPSGAEQWTHIIGNDTNNEPGPDVAVGAEGQVYVAAAGIGELSVDSWVIDTGGQVAGLFFALDHDGTLLWGRHTTGGSDTIGTAATVTAEGNPVFGFGFSGSPSLEGVSLSAMDDSDAALAAFDADGDLLWVNPLGGSGFQELVDIDAVDGGIAVVGSYTDAWTPGPQVATLEPQGLPGVFVLVTDEQGEPTFADAWGAERNEASAVVGQGGVLMMTANVSGEVAFADGETLGGSSNQVPLNGVLVAYSLQDGQWSRAYTEALRKSSADDAAVAVGLEPLPEDFDPVLMGRPLRYAWGGAFAGEVEFESRGSEQHPRRRHGGA